jgi:hypothetical protein
MREIVSLISRTSGQNMYLVSALLQAIRQRSRVFGDAAGI